MGLWLETPGGGGRVGGWNKIIENKEIKTKKHYWLSQNWGNMKQPGVIQLPPLPIKEEMLAHCKVSPRMWPLQVRLTPPPPPPPPPTIISNSCLPPLNTPGYTPYDGIAFIKQLSCITGLFAGFSVDFGTRCQEHDSLSLALDLFDDQCQNINTPFLSLYIYC